MHRRNDRDGIRSQTAGLDWEGLAHQVDEAGYAVTPTEVLDEATCRSIAEDFGNDALYRSTVDMARYRYGEGQYRYYRYPLPTAVAALREASYPGLVALANQWQQRLGLTSRYPEELEGLVEQCRQVGQIKPTPLILRYEEGGYNCLHQDLYGEIAFPLQITVALTEPDRDFTGGENLLVEQRPRAQSRGTAVSLPRGHALVFPNRYRPVKGTRGDYRVAVRHGVSTVRSGHRLTLGIIFHEAQ